MKSKVFFIDLRATLKKNFLSKIEELLIKAGISETVKKGDMTAVKLHFGEKGNTAFIRPVFIRKIVDIIRKQKAVPFLTDANTLYAGTRKDAPSHLKTAFENGFAYSVVDAPLIIADGLRGKTETPVQIDKKHFKEVFIGSEIVMADSFISVAHFKGHELAGFGGAIKNVGMGCASRRGKMAQHSDLCPKIVRKKCKNCGTCITHCAQEAISLKEEKALIDSEKCVGCGECIIVCPEDAINIQWNAEISVFMEKMVEYTVGVLKGKEGKSLFVNFITDVSPGCDCYGVNDAPIVRNIGVVASKDPVAADRACIDMVNNEPALAGSCIEKHKEPGQDKFKEIYPNIDWQIQLDYAQSIGLGIQEYEIVKL